MKLLWMKTQPAVSCTAHITLRNVGEIFQDYSWIQGFESQPKNTEFDSLCFFSYSVSV